MENPRVRKAVVAGQFYPASAQELKKQIAAFIDKEENKIDALACILPHAGYIYSGAVAAQTIASVKIKDTVILLGPNHTGYGAQFSIMIEGIWQTPLGEVGIDTQFAQQLLKRSRFLKEDYLAHEQEHSLEVELPFLQYFNPDFRIVPIVFMSDNPQALKEIGKEIALSIKVAGREKNTLIIASSDMTHYEPQKQAEAKDKEAIAAILELSEDRLIERVRALDISMCGYAPVAVTLSLVKTLGARQAKLIAYQTSGDVTGDYESVVGYAGVVIS